MCQQLDDSVGNVLCFEDVGHCLLALTAII